MQLMIQQLHYVRTSRTCCHADGFDVELLTHSVFVGFSEGDDDEVAVTRQTVSARRRRDDVSDHAREV